MVMTNHNNDVYNNNNNDDNEVNVGGGGVGGLYIANKSRAERIIVREVDSAISPGEFMEELYLKNLKEVMSLDDFRKEVHLVGEPWKADAGSVNVVLEGNSVAINTILGNDRCYIKWFAFFVRQFNSVEGCYRCCGFGHSARECRVEGVVCRRCGELGHRARGAYDMTKLEPPLELKWGAFINVIEA
ncbi:putative 50 kDa protein in type I retrotransposable element R1DM [Lucilia cuprina]|nr:putative 50 kDa protein in type I retrotransposable element R1DM [Lucilia cuprina]